MLVGVDAKKIPVVVRMQVECVKCGHHEDETYEFDLPVAKAQPMEAYEPGKCPQCGAPVRLHLQRRQQVQ
jgi:Zn ribbon nucleic-acid-binding protein